MNHFLDHEIYHFCIHLHTTHNHYKDLFFIGHFRLLYYWFEKSILSKGWCILQELGRLWRVSDCEELVEVTWRLSDCEELVGVTHKR